MNTKRSRLEELKEMGWEMKDIAQLLEELLVQLDPGREDQRTAKAEMTTKQKITVFMQKNGFTANLQGFKYLREAIDYCVEEGIGVQTTKVLYPLVAEKFNTTPSRVERAIRHAIERAFDNGSPELLELTGYSVNYKKGKPTNSEFIALVADQFRENLL